MPKIIVDPVTRLEGHLAIEAIVEGGVVKEAKSKGMLFRGFEIFLKGRNPIDAQRFTQRICGVCPTAHATASTLNLDSALIVGKGHPKAGEKLAAHIPKNGRIIRNLILGSNYIQSHLLHFYHLAALDYVDVAACADYSGNDPDLVQVKNFIGRGKLAPFLPRYDYPGVYRLQKEANVAATKHYVQALNMRRLSHEMLAIWGGHMPHNKGIIPGGVTENVTVDKIADFLWKLNKLRHFIDNVYIPDVLAVAEVYKDEIGALGVGWKKALAYGVFEMDSNPDLTKRQRFLPQGLARGLKPDFFDPNEITESVKHSKFKSGSNLHPSRGETVPDLHKEGAYSWVKSPRYKGEPFEVGPLANQLVAYLNKVKPTVKLVDDVLGKLKLQPENLFSVLGRHGARAIDCKVVADEMVNWLTQLVPGEPTHTPFEIPDHSEGMGITSAPRGSLGHWITIKDKKIDRYQAVVPTTWNASPKDEQGQPGPFEKCMIGTQVKNLDQPIELVRIIRSFDPCLACAIHVIDAKGNEKNRFIIRG